MTRNFWKIKWLRLGMAFIVMQIIVWALKLTINQPRPPGAYGVIGPSFPSDVAADAGFTAAFLTMRYPRYRILWHVFGMTISLLWMHQGAHYLQDIVVGYVLGFLVIRSTEMLTHKL